MLGKPQRGKLSILQDLSRSKKLVLNSGLHDSSATENKPPAVEHNLKAQTLHQVKAEPEKKSKSGHQH